MWQKRHRKKSTARITEPKPRPGPAIRQLTLWAFGCIIHLYRQEHTVKITIKIPKKHREHFVLFAQNTPFKQKVVENKKAFKRNPKHKGREQ